MKMADFIKVFAITAVIASGVQSQTIDWSAPNITITTAAQLKEFAAMSINGGNNFIGKTIKLGNNIDLNGNADNQWTPICGIEGTFVKNLCNGDYCEDEIYESVSFQGTFDGAGFVISRVYTVEIWDEIEDLDDLRWYPSVGLFGGCGKNGTVKNLGVVDSYISGYITGGLVGTNFGTIENCYVNGNFVEVRAGGLVGTNFGTIINCYANGDVKGFRASGLVAWNEGTIKNCYATGNVEHDVSSVGGLVACNVGTIENCYATGNVKGMEVGGLVGSNGGTITNCYATGNIEGISDFGNDVGGLVGYNNINDHGGTITNCYATGNVSVSVEGHYNNFGGLVGSGRNDIITSSYYDKETSGQSDDDGRGTPKTTAEMKRQNTYTGWDFTNIWAIDPAKNDGYPYLGIIEKQKTSIGKKATKKTAQAINFAGIKNGQINLNLKAGTYTAQLYNLQGRLVKSVNINATNGINATGLRTDNFSKGIFLLNVKQAGVSVLQQKITVK